MSTATRSRQPGRATVPARSFGGCSTCRSRHVKCDEGRPSCSACRDSGLVCGGYEKSIFFGSDGPDDAPVGRSLKRFRQFILTERERQTMSEWLTASVPPKSALRYITQIDDACDEASPRDDIHIRRGPFSAFSVGKPGPGRSTAAEPSLPAIGWSEEDGGGALVAQDALMADTHAAEDLISSDLVMPLSPTIQQSLELMFEPEWETSSLTFPSNLWDLTGDVTAAHEASDEASLPTLHLQTFRPDTPGCISGTTALEQPRAAGLVPPPAAPTPPPRSVKHNIPEHAVFLLKHYSTTVLNLLTPFRHTKTPWHILFIPHVKNCLAGLTLGETLDHASLSAFYGTLAISALSIGGVSESQLWLQQGKTFHQLSREHAREMLKVAYRGPKSAKYKSILMALITLVQVSMFSGNRDQTECYFLEAEKFIRLRGLSRNKSRKVRLLHHCYAFERILYESTITSEINSRHRLHVREAVESSGLVVIGQDRMNFRLSFWDDIQQEMTKIKGQADGENDLHLEHPGFWSATLYPEIFGIPEQWIATLSLVIRLSKEKEAAQVDRTARSPGLGNFMVMAKGVEKVVNHLPWPEQVEDGLDSLLGAWKQSLAIYFYRRIYDVDASLLQQKVVKVREHISCYETVELGRTCASARLIWPAFIAACEAEGLELQQSFADWFSSSMRVSGLQVFGDTLRTVEKSWQDRTSLADL